MIELLTFIFVIIAIIIFLSIVGWILKLLGFGISLLWIGLKPVLTILFWCAIILFILCAFLYQFNMSTYFNDTVIDIYPGLEWIYNNYRFVCTGVESFLYNKSYKIMLIDNKGKYHTLRHRSSRLRLSEMYNKFVKYCEL